LSQHPLDQWVFGTTPFIMKLKRHLPFIPYSIFLLALGLVFSPLTFAWAQIILLDDVRRDILFDNKEQIKSINQEIEQRKKRLEKEKEEKRQVYEEKIKSTQLKLLMEKQDEIITKSKELLEALEERTKFDSQERWNYEQLIKQTAEKPLETLPPEEQEEAANRFLASATQELVEILKEKAIETAKMKRGEEYEEVEISKYLLIKLQQYTQLANSIKSMEVLQQEKIVSRKDSVLESSEELIEFLKQEAIRRTESKRKKLQEDIAAQRMQFKNFKTSASIHHGYDNNINADNAYEGGSFIRNYASLSWLPSFSEYFKAELGTWYLADNYTQDQDVSFRIWTGQTNVKFFPRGNDSLEIRPAFEFSDTYYPNNPGLNSKENKLSLLLAHRFKKGWSQNLTYEELWTNNSNNRPARNAAGDDRPGYPLERHRRRVEYDLGFPLPFGINANIEQRLSFQTSNDNFLDFYDYESYRILGNIGRSLTDRLYSKFSFSYETKNYKNRTVSDIQVAQKDSTYTKRFSLFYFFKDGILFNYTWTVTKVDSNDPLFDYAKMTHLVGAHFSF